MPGATKATITDALKDIYLPAIRSNVTTSEELYKRFEKNEEDVSGLTAKLSLQYSGNAGIGSFSETGQLPEAGKQKYKMANYDVKRQAGRVKITDEAIKRSRTDAGAFARMLDREIQGLAENFRTEINRVLNGKGTGELTLVSLASTGTLVTVKTTRFITEDMKLDINGDKRDVITVDSDTEFTVNSAVTVAVDEVVKRQDADEPNGIANVVDNTGVIGGIDGATVVWWRSTKLANAGTLRDLTLDLFADLQRSVEKRTNKPSDFYYCNFELRDKYMALLVADRRFPGTTQLDVSTVAAPKYAEYNGRAVVADIYSTDNVIYAFTKRHFNIFQQGAIDWMDGDGAVLSRVANEAAYEATLLYYWQFGTDNRRNQAKLTDLKQ